MAPLQKSGGPRRRRCCARRGFTVAALAGCGAEDSNPRHFGPRLGYCTSSEARLPLLFADGAVHVRAAADSNQGWVPSSPTTGSGSQFIYQPAAWEPPSQFGSGTEVVMGRFRWTRGRIAGRDFDGPEVCTGQPGCP